MSGRYLIVFEEDRVCSEALMHAREVALRMDLSVELLMIVDAERLVGRTLEATRDALGAALERANRRLREVSERFASYQVETESRVRVGVPLVALLEHVAEGHRWYAVIWGSDGQLPAGDASGQRHWAHAIGDGLGCPFFTVNSRGTGAG